LGPGDIGTLNSVLGFTVVALFSGKIDTWRPIYKTFISLSS